MATGTDHVKVPSRFTGRVSLYRLYLIPSKAFFLLPMAHPKLLAGHQPAFSPRMGLYLSEF